MLLHGDADGSMNLTPLLCTQEPNTDQDVANLQPLVEHDVSSEPLAKILCSLEGDAEKASRLHMEKECAFTFGLNIHSPKVQEAGI